MANTDRVEARYYRREGDAFVCELCQQKCFIRNGEFGICGTRRADDDILVCNNYGKISSLSVDPIERVNLYHYRPHTKCFTVGTVGCNMNCRYCKNYSFSKLSIGKKRATYKSAEDIIEMCREEGMETIAFTYNEPMVWFEYILDVARTAPDLNIVLQTNCWANDGPLREICDVTDAMSIDVKAFDRDFYKDVCDGSMKDVLINTTTVYDRGVHLELNYLVVPGMNDSEEQIGSFCEWVSDALSDDVPVHFSRFQPDYEIAGRSHDIRRIPAPLQGDRIGTRAGFRVCGEHPHRRCR